MIGPIRIAQCNQKSCSITFSYTIQSYIYLAQLQSQIRESGIYSKIQQDDKLPKQTELRRPEETKDSSKHAEEQSELSQLIDRSSNDKMNGEPNLEGA